MSFLKKLFGGSAKESSSYEENFGSQKQQKKALRCRHGVLGILSK